MRSTWLLLKLAFAVVVLSTVLGSGAFAASYLYRDYGTPRVSGSVESWANRPIVYLATDCRACHDPQAQLATSSGHAALICETCHRPTVDHPGPVAGVVAALPVATSDDCLACHESTAGRPADWPTVAIASHYAGAACVTCHDPHSTAAVRPPEVTHPLDHLPDCVDCHAPDRLKSFPAGHVSAPDDVCLACHRPGAGES